MHHQQAIGERLRASRESRSLSQDDLAAKTGMTKAAIYEIEAGKRADDVDHRAPGKSARLSGGLAGVRGLKECLAECQFGNGRLCSLRGLGARQHRRR